MNRPRRLQYLYLFSFFRTYSAQLQYGAGCVQRFKQMRKPAWNAGSSAAAEYGN